MLQNEQIELLDKLRFGETSQERNQALKDLKLCEAEGKISESDILSLLEDKDYVYQTYAVGAIGRFKSSSAIPKLQKLFKTSTDPILLSLLLETFIKFESDSFCDCVVKKLEELSKSNDSDSNDRFIFEQIIVPSLKYFQGYGKPSVEKIVSGLLEDENPSVRWHALMTYDKLGLEISKERLSKLVDSEKYALVREQATIMLEKLKKG